MDRRKNMHFALLPKHFYFAKLHSPIDILSFITFAIPDKTGIITENCF